ncbi:MAG: hypothetical protein M1294_11355 [Firmicutes bacterium]|nr:hypothetical protein [Bacillota bacterium]
MRGILVSEWLRLRKWWGLWIGLAANWGVLGWRLWTQYSGMVAHLTLAAGSRVDALWSASALLPYVLTLAWQFPLINVLIWGAVGAFWTETDWRAGLPAEHLVRGGVRYWIGSRLLSYTIYVLIVVLGDIGMAYGVGWALGSGVAESSWQVAGSLLPSAVAGPWLVGVVGLGFATLWQGAIGGGVSLLVLWWEQRYVQGVLIPWIFSHVGRTMSWMVAALNPLNAWQVLSDPLMRWGTTLQQHGAWTTFYFVPQSIPVGILLGGYATRTATGRMQVHSVVYHPPVGVLVTLLALQIGGLTWGASISYRQAARQWDNNPPSPPSSRGSS